MKDLGFKLFLTVLGIAIAGIPSWLYLLMSSALNPEGFWQNLVMVGVGLYVLGGFQFILLIGLFAWLWAVWTN